MAINIIKLVGYVAHQPDVHHFEDGTILCQFPVIVESDYGDNESLFESLDLEIRSKTAEIAAQYIAKGHLIGVIGSLKFSNSLDQKIGKSKNQPIILVDQIYLLKSKPNAQTPLVSTPEFRHRFRSILELDCQDCEEDYIAYEDKDEYEEDEYSPQGYYQEFREYDTSVDYGYLEDMNGYFKDISSLYKHFNSFGDFDTFGD